MNYKDELGKTPSKYAGLKPDLDESFLPYWRKWNDEEKLEYVRYLERDSYRRAFTFTAIFLLFFVLLVVFWIFGTPVDN